jgi:rfaE bifunctional protein kinase chain/domain
VLARLRAFNNRSAVTTAWSEVEEFARLATVKAVVFGDFCLDAYWDVDASHGEISVETGHPVHRVTQQRYSLGGAGNVASNLHALGVTQIRAIGVHGGDPFGALMVRLLAKYADISGMVDSADAPSTYVYAKPYIAGVEQPRYDFVTYAAPPYVVQRLITGLDEAKRWADVVLVSQQLRGVLTDPQVLAAVNDLAETEPSLPVVVDCRDAAADISGAILKLNRAEAEVLFGTSGSRQRYTLGTAYAAAIDRGVPLFITLGDAGIATITADGVQVFPGVEVDGPIDTVGAGDTVQAAIGAALGAGLTTNEAAELANLAASVTIRKLASTGTADPAEIVAAKRDASYVYNVDVAEDQSQADLFEGTEIEVVEAIRVDRKISHAIFDHDGTLSSLRAGWESLMLSLMIEVICGVNATIDDALRDEICDAARGLIERSTGAPTLVQMQGLVDLVQDHGLVPEDDVLDAAQYKALYNSRLSVMVRDRLTRLAEGELTPSDFHIKGALLFLLALRRAGITLHLASGTDANDVVADATALGYADLFDGRIFGAGTQPGIDAKRVVVSEIALALEPNATFVVFGDGPVEMREARRGGGIAVGVCSGDGHPRGYDSARRARLIRAGAHLLVPDFADLRAIFAALTIPMPALANPGDLELI